MTTRTVAGHCPHCGTSISAAYVLIEYERSDGQQAAFAECPGCEHVVRPG